MKVISPNSVKQEDDSCRLAITGISYFIGSEQYKNKDLKSLFIDLCKAVLKDDQTEADSIIENDVTVIVCNLSTASAPSFPKEKQEVTAAQLANWLSFCKDNACYDKIISNPLQALHVANNKLKSDNNKAILLLVIDPQSVATAKNIGRDQIDDIIQSDNLFTGNGDKSCHLAAFVIRSLSQAQQNQKRIYASVPLLFCTTNSLSDLDSQYRKAEISAQSINLFALSIKSSFELASTEINKLSRWFLNCLSAPKSSNLPWCSLRITTDSEDGSNGNTLLSLIETLLALQQRVFLPFESQDLIEQMDLKHSPFYFNVALRTWFHPQIHPQLRQMSPQPSYIPSLRRAAMHFIEDDGQAYHIVLQECEDINESKQKNLQSDWPSEVFTFFACNRLELSRTLELIKSSLSRIATPIQLKDLAFSINKMTAERIDKQLSVDKNASNIATKTNNGHVRVAFVSANLEDFLQKLTSVIKTCLDTNSFTEYNSLSAENQDIYWHLASADDNREQNKLAFILPGLGAAYPNMLAELCLHFPEIRAIFDFIDEISVLAGDQSRPSDRIFSRMEPRTKLPRETPASLAVMDSAVVTVLLAEWAIFTLLLNLGIVPDILLGCSTGEFAALTMSGAIDIMKAAPLFYHLSTGVVRALPINKLINLRSLKINASLNSTQSTLNEFQGKVHLSADLSSCQLIVTGDKESINSLAKDFESKNISADFLPFAIPYHTSLVSDVVSVDNPDIAALQIGSPLIESWSCSLAKKYPTNPHQIKKMTTELFSKPILFKDSIEALYQKGVRLFVEVGPRGSLAPMISETLHSRPHISLAANLADRSALTQFQHVLAALFVNGIYMDLNYLHLRRSSKLLPIIQEDIRLNKRPPYTTSFSQSTQYRNKAYATATKFPESETGQNITILQTAETFQRQLLQLEQQVISYLKINHLSASGNYLSKEVAITQLFKALQEDKYKTIVCRQLLERKLPKEEKALLALAESKLVSSELAVFNSFRQLAKRKQWLSGRIAAKEAIRILLHNRFDKLVNDHQIEIALMPSAKPYVISNGIVKDNPIISITHKHAMTIAVAADNSIFSAIGVDLESILSEDNDLEQFILTAQERDIIQHLSTQERAHWLKKIWAAKEAVAKSLGLGLPDCFTKLFFADILHDKSQLLISLNNASDLSIKANAQLFITHISQLGEMIFALTAY